MSAITTPPTEHLPPPPQRASARRFISLALTLAVAEFKLRFAGSYLSYVWSFCKPLMLFGILYFVFTRGLRLGAGTPHSALALLLGIVLWYFFSEITSVSVTLLVARSDMLRKLSFPRFVLPLSISFSALLTLVLNLIVVLAFMVSSGLEPTLHWLEVPLLVGELYVLALGLGLILSSLYVRFRDLGQIWEVLLQGLFYGAPVIYSLTSDHTKVPTSTTMRHIILIDPAGQIIQQAKHAIVPGAADSLFKELPAYEAWIPYALTVIIFAFGVWIFQRITPTLAEHL